ncbi:hypothetical protein C8Q77DRAFT_447390 [Trametes polyzona]|nr:hypothetical protein C8Q77DRAFT_447390 [Trametes polyzona]
MDFIWSDNPEGNYIMIEPNVKFMIHSQEALRRAPRPWYARPPPTPVKPLPVDKLRFLPTRRLQNSLSSQLWTQTVGDDLDSLSYTFLHALLFRAYKGSDRTAAKIAGYYSTLGSSHPKRLMDWRDDVETQFWIISEDVKSARKASGKEPDGTSIEAFAEELYKLHRVNIAHHSQERALAGTIEQKEGMHERSKKQYDDYLQAMETLKAAIDNGWARKQEEKRKKAELKASQKAEKTEKTQEPEGPESKAEDTEPQQDIQMKDDDGKASAETQREQQDPVVNIVEQQDVPMGTEEAADAPELEESGPPTKRARLE